MSNTNVFPKKDLDLCTGLAQEAGGLTHRAYCESVGPQGSQTTFSIHPRNWLGGQHSVFTWKNS